MKPGKLQGEEQRWRDLCWKDQDLALAPFQRVGSAKWLKLMQRTCFADLSQGLSIVWEIPNGASVYTLGENAVEKKIVVFTHITVVRVLAALAIRAAH